MSKRNVVLDRSARLAEWAQIHPDKPVLIDDRGDSVRTMTYRELDDETNRIAHALRGLGLEPGQRVAWMGRNSIEVVALIQGAAKAGYGVVALNHRMQRSDAYDMLNFANAGTLWVESDAAAMFDDVTRDTPVRTVIVWEGAPGPGQVAMTDLLADQPTTEVPPLQLTGDTGPMMAGFTSGTTGKPKRVIRDPKGTLNAEMAHLSRLWGKDDHVFITSGSISSGAAGGYYSLALSRGDTIVLQRKFDPEDWMRLADKYRVTIAYFAPTIARQICNLPDEVKKKYDISSIRTVVAGAAKWSYALKLAYRDTFPENTLWEIYGSTELGSNTVMRPHEHWGKPESCGRAIEGIELLLLDENGDPVTKPNERGVLWVKSDFASGFLGYENDEAATASAVNGDYRSVGDIAYFDEEGFYYICDRVKDMVVTGGVNVFPAEVEAVIDSYPGVLECVVFGIPDETWGEKVHAVVVPKDGLELDASGIIEFCREHLASHKVPRGVDFLPELPHTVSGKILKREVRNRYWEGAGRLI